MKAVVQVSESGSVSCTTESTVIGDAGASPACTCCIHARYTSAGHTCALDRAHMTPTYLVQAGHARALASDSFSRRWCFACLQTLRTCTVYTSVRHTQHVQTRKHYSHTTLMPKPMSRDFGYAPRQRCKRGNSPESSTFAPCAHSALHLSHTYLAVLRAVCLARTTSLTRCVSAVLAIAREICE